MSNAAFPVLLGVVVIDANNNSIRVTENGVSQTLTITAGSYYLRGDGASDDLLVAIAACIQSHTGTNTYTCTVVWSMSYAAASAVVTTTRATGSNTFAILWADNATTFDPLLLGCAATNTAENSSAKAGTLSPSCVWVGNDIYRSLEPVPAYQVAQSRAVSGKVRTVQRAGEFRDRLWVQEYIEERRMNAEAIAADPTRALSRFVARCAAGARFEFHDGAISSGTTLSALSGATLVDVFVMSLDFFPTEGKTFASRLDGGPLFSFTGILLPYVDDNADVVVSPPDGYSSWWKGSDVDGSLNATLSDDGHVSSWHDSGPDARHLIQGTDANRPHFQLAGGSGGRDAVSFDLATQQFLRVSFGGGTETDAKVTIGIVFKPSSASPVLNYLFTGATSADVNFAIGDNYAAHSGIMFRDPSLSSPAFTTNNFNMPTFAAFVGFIWVILEYDGASSRVRVADTGWFQGTDKAMAVGTPTNASSWTLGTHYADHTFGFDGIIQEVILYKDKSDAIQAGLDTYLDSLL